MIALGLLSLAIWIGLLLVRGGFWRADCVLPAGPATPATAPPVTVLVPARNEAAVIAAALESLLAQDYPGPLAVRLIDDGSTDGTAEIAGRIAESDPRLAILTAPPLPAGWTGKLWALQQGVPAEGAPGGTLDGADSAMDGGGYFWMSDADIRHAPDVLSRLVAKAEAEDRDLVSVMARLDISGAWARLAIPAFIYFFQKLYPFAWVNDPAKRTAAAAGGCVLIRRDAFRAVGGYRPIADALIDDVALGRLMKDRPGRRSGAIWLGFADGVDSLRPSATLGDIWMMVARTAFTQLNYSALQLVGTVLGMILLYLLPPALAVVGGIGLVTGTPGAAAVCVVGAGATVLAMGSFLPTLNRYDRSPWLALGLPLAGLLYTGMTVDSARRYWQGTGGSWKGRAQARPGGPPQTPTPGD